MSVARQTSTVVTNTATTVGLQKWLLRRIRPLNEMVSKAARASDDMIGAVMSQSITRRDLAKLALATLPAARLLAKPNSKIDGVQLGINVPYSFHNAYNTAQECLDATVKLDLSAVELRAQPIEAYMGAPAALIAYPKPRRPAGEPAPDPKAAAAELRTWRLATSMNKVKDFRKFYENAGVKIEIVKVDAIDTFSDEEIDYMFNLARTAGARAISCEIPLSHTKRLGEFAEKHKMMVGYHGHTDVTSPEAFGRPESWETAMTYSKYNGINLDIGHFIAGNSKSPIPFLEKYHDRVTHIHVKDRKMNNGPNVPFGQGDTPIKETLKLMQKEKYPFPGIIEFEYPVPQGSDQMTEIAKCVAYCKNALA
jgi:Xylose isomerase-like TIM barrel